MGVSGVGYGGFGQYPLNGYASVPNSYMGGVAAQAAGSSVGQAAGAVGAGVTGAAAAAVGAAGAAGAGTMGVASAAAGGEQAGTGGRGYGTADLKALKRTGAVECQTCRNRTYQDGSNDPGVSFKAPGHIDPTSSGAVVASHEQEHVSNEKANAAATGRRVVSQSVRLFTAVCPECGRVYVSGGETRTVTASDNSPRQASAYKSSGNTSGKLFNAAV